MRKYPKYKNSGIAWVGAIPDDWVKSKFKILVFYQEGPGLRSFQFTESGIRVICVSNITDKGIDFETTHTRHISWDEYEEKYKHFTVQDNDILLSSSGSIGKVSKYHYDGEHVMLNTSTIRIHTKDNRKILNEFLPFYLGSEYVQIQLRFLMTGGIVNNFGPSHLDQLFLYLPPLPEQQQIVTYLDHKTTLIDQIISGSEKKIELLKEQRTATINHAVTKGLNPKVKMKDSGVQWIGEIPEGWDISPLRFLYKKIGSGVTPRGGGEVYVEDGVIFIRSQNVHFDGLRLDDVVKIEEETHHSMKGTWVLREDVLLNITGGSIGRCCIVKSEQPMNVNQHVCIIRPNNRINPYFLNQILQSSIGQTQIDLYITGGNREGLSTENIKNFKVTIPPIQEQQQIVTYLDQKTKEIDDLIASEKKRIELLKEYRQSLISEVVTGKIKVTNE
jgi:type I restriction enzyme S subunit